MSSRFLSAAVVGAVGLFIASACGSSDESTFGSSGGSSGFGGSSSGSIGGSSGTSGNIDELAACATETLNGEALPLDIYIMLDASSSMNEAAGGTSRWDAVRSALKAFVTDPKSSGIGVGLQIFPVVNAAAPTSCTSDADCTGFGSCFSKACDYSKNGAYIPCDSSADCPDNAHCGALRACNTGVNGACVDGGNSEPFGCQRHSNQCRNGTILNGAQCTKKECVASDYDNARVPIAALPGNAAALTSDMDSIQPPVSPPAISWLTPTSAAVTGGLAYAKAHLAANPGHAVVLVLATDGLPTRCPPYDGASIGAIAATGGAVKTFVVGVIGNSPLYTQAEAKAKLDAIASGGGTGSALIVNTTGNVTDDFLKAMDQIRGAALPCDYKVPSPQSGTPDYGRVNVKFTKGDGTASVFPQAKGGAGSCDAGGGWYYDVDPSTGGTPTKITLCPASCDAVKNSGSGAKVDVLLGCQTIVK